MPPLPASSVEIPKRKRIILVEDHPVTRAGVAALLDQPDLQVCGQAATVAEGLKLIQELSPDMVITDITLKESSGVELVKQLKTSHPQLPVLIMSMHDESFYAERALRAGARGYVMKQEASEKILEAVRRVMKNELYLSQNMREKMLHGLVHRKQGEQITYSMDTLSNREMEVFLLLGEGHGTKKIGEMLSLSTKTVDTYRENLKVKLRLEGAAELIRHAVQWCKSEKVIT